MSQDKPVLREFLEKWMNRGLLQSYESREKFRKEANELYLALSALDRQGWIAISKIEAVSHLRDGTGNRVAEANWAITQDDSGQYFKCGFPLLQQINEPPQVIDGHSAPESSGVNTGPASGSPDAEIKEKDELLKLRDEGLEAERDRWSAGKEDV
jgi:hypothetical protein